MKQEMKRKWLDKYYNGETTLNEEEEGRKAILSEENKSAEKVMFSYFASAGEVPEGLETELFDHVQKTTRRTKTIRMRFFSMASAAAVIIILLGIYLDFRETRKTKIENDFFTMEQALYQVSESIQPEKQNDMLVLWVDDDVEIIIN